jgi:hypothetical protein
MRSELKLIRRGAYNIPGIINALKLSNLMRGDINESTTIQLDT